VWIPFTSAESGEAVRLHGLWLGQPAVDAPVLLYLHGARWDVRGSAPRMRRMHELGFSVLGIDYRGFGRSTAGLPSEALAGEDARAAWQWLATRAPGAPRVVFGHSLGGAIAPLMLSACMIGFPAFLSTFNRTLDPAYTASAAEEPQQDSTPELTSATAPQDPVDKPIQVGVDSVENGQRSEAKWVTERSIK
jgi:alpha-beta hydrolase superfamily lysophospholipase